MPSADDLQRALNGYSADIRRAFLDAVAAHAGAIDFAQLEQLLQAGRLEEAAQMLAIPDAPLWRLQEAVRAAFLDAGASVAAPRLAQGVFTFSGRNARAEQWLIEKGASIREGITDEAIKAARVAIADGMASGRGLRSVALDLAGRLDKTTGVRTGGVIALSTQQVDYAKNARAELENLDAAYFDRELRDRKFDKLVQAAISANKPLGQADIDRIVASYRNKMLAYRGTVIAKDQAFQAQASGRHEAYLQMAADPRFLGVTVRWQHNLSQYPRQDHVAMSGTVVQIGMPFVFPDGVAMDHPHDPAAPARHNIGCRCIAVYRAIPRL